MVSVTPVRTNAKSVYKTAIVHKVFAIPKAKRVKVVFRSPTVPMDFAIQKHLHASSVSKIKTVDKVSVIRHLDSVQDVKHKQIVQVEKPVKMANVKTVQTRVIVLKAHCVCVDCVKSTAAVVIKIAKMEKSVRKKCVLHVPMTANV